MEQQLRQHYGRSSGELLSLWTILKSRRSCAMSSIPCLDLVTKSPSLTPTSSLTLMLLSKRPSDSGWQFLYLSHTWTFMMPSLEASTFQLRARSWSMPGGSPTTLPTGKTLKNSGQRGSWKRRPRLRPMAMISGTFHLELGEGAVLELFLHCQFLALLWDVWYRISSSCLLPDSQRSTPQRKVDSSVCTYWSTPLLLQSQGPFNFISHFLFSGCFVTVRLLKKKSGMVLDAGSRWNCLIMI